MTSQPASTGTGGKPQGPLPPLLLTLTVVTGVVDAVSILRLGRVFVANMTGNVVFSGFALVGAPGFSLRASLAALAGFLVGALAGGVLAGRLGRDRGLLLRAGAAAELVLVAGALALTAGLPGGRVPGERGEGSAEWRYAPHAVPGVGSGHAGLRDPGGVHRRRGPERGSPYGANHRANHSAGHGAGRQSGQPAALFLRRGILRQPTAAAAAAAG
jgi:hypothetical protein